MTKRRNPVGAYVLCRIRAEFFDAGGDPIRGKQAELARLTGFTTSQVNHAFTSAREGRETGVGQDFARAMATKVWGISYAELEHLTEAWAAARPVPALKEEEPPFWKHDPGWPDALREALAERRRRGLRIPEPYFGQAGDAVVPGRRPTAEGVVRLAELLWTTDLEPDPPVR